MEAALGSKLPCGGAAQTMESLLFECPLLPMSQDRIAPAAKVRNLPFMSKCAWCSKVEANGSRRDI